MRYLLIFALLFVGVVSAKADKWTDAHWKCKKKFAGYKLAGMPANQWGCWEPMCAYEACMAESSYKGVSQSPKCQQTHIQVYNQCMRNKSYTTPYVAGLKAPSGKQIGSSQNILTGFLNKIVKWAKSAPKSNDSNAGKEWLKRIKGDAKGTFHMLSKKVKIFRGMENPPKPEAIQLSRSFFDGSVPVELEDGTFYISMKDAATVEKLAKDGIQTLELGQIEAQKKEVMSAEPVKNDPFAKPEIKSEGWFQVQ